MKQYSIELKEKVVKFHLSEGRSMASLEREYNLSKGCVSNWIKSYSKECQTDENKQKEKDNYSRISKLERENSELRKENIFLKKATAFFARETQL